MSQGCRWPAVLTIAGSDSGGGAGIQADLKTFAAHGCYGTSAITALTAQNTIGVQDVFPTPPEFLGKQITSILSDIDIKAIKTGMLFDAANTLAAIAALKDHYSDSDSNASNDSKSNVAIPTPTLPPLVCDPVCVSTSGHTLLDPDAISVIVEELFPLAVLVTPNKAEAELILNLSSSPQRQSHRDAPTLPRRIETLHDMILAAQNLLSLGSKAVLLKGGHLVVSSEDVRRISEKHPSLLIVRDGILPDGGNMEILQANTNSAGVQLVVDVLCQTVETADRDDSRQKPGPRMTLFCRPRVDSTNTHGTGCTLSSAVAAELALGADVSTAVRRAVRYTYFGIIAANPTIGHGHGPLNHFHSMSELVVPRPTPTTPYPLTTLLIHRAGDAWKAYVEHEFVRLLGKGTLPRENFVHFIRQDYLYLKYYARAYALLSAKSTTFPSISRATQTVLNVLQEINTHKAFCASFGVTEDELEQTPESAATAAYGGYLVDVGLRGDTTLLLIALLACLLGYGEVGLWLKKNVRKNGKDITTTRDAGEGADGGWVIMNENDNPYVQWIEDYAGERYQAAVRAGLELIETRAASDPPSRARFEEWFAVWKRCTELEKGFWDMAMSLS
ncbi:Ribokinase-like protein [Lentinula raphanica]|nr:Ribokinase-like protein [Lentinula raphanica]